jgi:UDP-arabinose 4-epimerase
MASILVTGGAGYIGSHVCKALAGNGFQPIAYDNLSQGHAHAVQWGPLVEGDIADRRLLAETMQRFRVAAVMHFAALIQVGDSMREPLRYLQTNVGGSLTLLQAMVESDVRSIVFSSTCAIYGTPRRLPLDEQHPQAPVNAYGASKMMVEQSLGWAAQAHGLTHAALRYFNAAGADPAGELGEEHEPETHLIPLVLQAACGARPAIDIFGTDWPTPDGTCIRDYVHVCDLADAHLSALRHLLAGGASLAVNLGTGCGYSVLEVIDAVERVTGRPVPRHMTSRRMGDPPVLVADPRLAQTALNWLPRHSDLDQIVQTAWQWLCRDKKTG